MLSFASKWLLAVTALSSFSCGATQPAYAQTIDPQADDIILLCQKDFLEFLEGRPNWLIKKLEKLPPAQQDRVLTYCHFYARGMLDGVVITQPKALDALKGM